MLQTGYSLFPVCSWLVISIYLSSTLVAHLNDAPQKTVVTGDSARIQDETAENSAWSVYSMITLDLGLTSDPKDYK